MERWYVAFNTVGSPHDILSRLVQAVRQHQLGDFVVRFCYEKMTKKNRGQFYFFVGVVSEQKGFVPESIHSEFYIMLNRLGLRDLGMHLYFEEIKTGNWISNELEIHNLRQIKMLKPAKLPPTDPFNFESKPSTEKPDISLNESYNKLLYWLSAYGRGTWQQFKTACKELGLDPEGEYSRRIMRRLRSLGHVELTKDGQNWFIAPPALVVTVSDSRQHYTFLAGQRSPILIQELEEVAQVETEPQPYSDAPDVIRVTFSSQSVVESFIQDFAINYHPVYMAGLAGFEIASNLPNLEIWEADLPSLAIVKGNYIFEQWLRDGFKSIELPKDTGLYRLTHISTRFGHPQLTLFYHAESDSWRKGDWYGLRYLMMQHTGETCEFHYDHNLKRLSIAMENRPPDIYERSLVLASGRLPIFRNGRVIFGDVPETLAHMLATKLEAEFIEYKGI